MKNLIAAAVLVIFNIMSIHAQNRIYGTVTDRNGEPLAGVNIREKGTENGTVSDKDGRYSFVLKGVSGGNPLIVFSFIGMEQKTVRAKVSDGGETRIDAVLEESLDEIAGVEVVGIGERKEIRDVKQQGVPVSVIDGRMLSGRGTSLSEVLNHQTGVKLRQTGGAGSQTKINVRGLEGNRVQIYMDGYALNTPDGNFSINDIPLQFIDRIEIYKGIVPAEFGGDGLGSAINVVTIDADKDFYDAGYRYQSYGVHDASATVRHFFKRSKVAMTLYASGMYAENDYTIDSPYEEGLRIKRDHDRLKMINFSVGLDFMDNWFDKSEIELLGYLNNKQIQGIQSNIQHTFTHGQTYGANVHLEKTGFFAEKLDMKFNGGYLFINSGQVDTSSVLYDFHGNEYVNSSGGEVGSIPNLSDDYTHDVRYNLNLKYRILPETMSVNLNNDYRIVLQNSSDPVAGAFLGRDLDNMKARVSGMITSLSVENKWFKKKLTSVLTGRHYFYKIKGETVDLTFPGSGDTPQFTDRSGNNFGYSLALKYDLPRHWHLKVAFEHNYRLPRSEELLGDRMNVMTNPSLLPENANNINFGTFYDHYYGNESRLQVEMNVYVMKVNNMMYSTAQYNFLKYANLGQALLYGADAEVKWDIDRHWFVSLNGTWQKSLDNSKYVPGTNTVSQTYMMQLPHIPVLYFNWMADYRKDNLFGGRGQYTRIYYEGGFTGQYYYGFELSKKQDYKIPASCIHTVGIEYGILDRKIIFGVECHNVLDSPEMTNFNYPLAGRTLTAKVRFTTLEW